MKNRRKEFGPIDVAVIDAIERRAIAEGRHCPIEQWRTLCQGCREWVNSIYYTTEQGVRLCGACADKFGQGPEADKRKFGHLFKKG